MSKNGNRFPGQVTARPITVLCVGDVFGEPGRRAIEALLPKIKKQYDVDVAVVNVENAAGGFGVTQQIAESVLDLGVDVMTTGNHVWDKKEIALSYKGVEMCYAIQAGRELRVLTKADIVSDLDAHQLAKDITKRIETEMQYPGHIKVVVIRETRAVEVAK